MLPFWCHNTTSTAFRVILSNMQCQLFCYLLQHFALLFVAVRSGMVWMDGCNVQYIYTVIIYNVCILCPAKPVTKRFLRWEDKPYWGASFTLHLFNIRQWAWEISQQSWRHLVGVASTYFHRGRFIKSINQPPWTYPWIAPWWVKVFKSFDAEIIWIMDWHVLHN